MKMHAERIKGIIDGLCERSTSQYEIQRLHEIRTLVFDAECEIDTLTKQLDRYKGLEGMPDEKLATLIKFGIGMRSARPGRKSSVKEVRSHIEFYWDWFLTMPAAWKMRMEEIEQEYPKSVVYKALKSLIQSM